MKMYRFFKLPSHKNDIPYLYALTDNKEFKKKFTETRDMDKFHLETDNVTKEIFNQFKAKYGYAILGENGMYTRSKYDPSKRMIVDVLCTWKEYESIALKIDDNFTDIIKMQMGTMMSVNTLLPEIQNILNDLGYFEIYARMYNKEHEHSRVSNSEYTKVLVFDELAVFLKMYSELFKIK